MVDSNEQMCDYNTLSNSIPNGKRQMQPKNVSRNENYFRGRALKQHTFRHGICFLFLRKFTSRLRTPNQLTMR